jgi:hypothetical protein
MSDILYVFISSHIAGPFFWVFDIFDRRFACRKNSLYSGKHKHIYCRHTSMPRTEFETTIHIVTYMGYVANK